MSDLTIPLPWTAPPVSQNDRQHHHVKAKAVARALAEADRPCERCVFVPTPGGKCICEVRR